MIRYLQMLWYSLRMKKLAPFRIYRKASIHIDTLCALNIDGRITIGNPHYLPVVSVQPPNLYFAKGSKVTIGHSVSIGPGVNIIVKENAALCIGDSTYFTSDMHIEVMSSVYIGKECAISWGITIIDDDHHRIIGGASENTKSEVVIGDHVWIGCNTTILKGSHIGDGCVIAANSLVKGNFPPNSLIGGNPARVLRSSVNWE